MSGQDLIRRLDQFRRRKSCSGCQTIRSDAGKPRQEAYVWVQRNAMRAWRGEGEFLTLLKADKDVAKTLSARELEALFDLDYHLRRVDEIFERVFGE